MFTHKLAPDTHTHTNITHHQRAAAAVEEIRESNKHTHTAKRKPSTVCDASEPRSGRCVFHPIGGKQRTIAYGSLRELARRARPLVRFYVCTICVAAAVAAAADAATTFHSTPASHGLVSILCLCIVRVCVCVFVGPVINARDGWRSDYTYYFTVQSITDMHSTQHAHKKKTRSCYNLRVLACVCERVRVCLFAFADASLSTDFFLCWCILLACLPYTNTGVFVCVLRARDLCVN